MVTYVTDKTESMKSCGDVDAGAYLKTMDSRAFTLFGYLSRLFLALLSLHL